jgi:hypothetical protein
MAPFTPKEDDMRGEQAFFRKKFQGILTISLILLVAAPAFSASTKDAANDYFATLKKDLDKLAASPALKNQRTKGINGLFVASLKKHQPVAYLARVSAKGIIVNEVIRGEVPKKKVNTKVGDAEWYSSVVKSQKPYTGFTEENGRYYLVWSDAVISKKRLSFVIVSKVDIWDCFHKLANETPEPFLVRIGQKSLYSNKWKNESAYAEDQLDVPGVENVSILSEKPSNAARTAETLATSVHRDTSAAVSTQAASPAQPNAATIAKSSLLAKHRTLVIIIAVIGILLLVLLIFRFYVWLNHHFLMRSINKPD